MCNWSNLLQCFNKRKVCEMVIFRNFKIVELSVYIYYELYLMVAWRYIIFHRKAGDSELFLKITMFLIDT